MASNFYLRLYFSSRSISSTRSIGSNSFKCQYMLYSLSRARSLLFSRSAFELKWLFRGELSRQTMFRGAPETLLSLKLLEPVTPPFSVGS